MEIEPSQFFEALVHSLRYAAMQSEINALARNKIWTLIALPFLKKTLGCK